MNLDVLISVQKVVIQPRREVETTHKVAEPESYGSNGSINIFSAVCSSNNICCLLIVGGESI